MTRTKSSLTIAILTAAACGAALFAEGPMVNIDQRRHGVLRGAQMDIVSAYQKVQQAQKINHYDMDGHAGRALDLLNQADNELKQAAKAADKNR